MNIETIRPRYRWVAFLALFDETWLEPIAARLIDRETARLTRAIPVSRPEPCPASTSTIKSYRDALERSSWWNWSVDAAVRKYGREHVSEQAVAALPLIETDPVMRRQFEDQADPVEWIMLLPIK